MAGQYRGSQAFTHIIPTDGDSIDPNTGSLSFKALVGKLNGFGLNLIYTTGNSGVFSLPSNWSLGLPYLLDGKSFTTDDGRTYAVDFEWNDATGFSSGLKYLNSDGGEKPNTKLQEVLPPQSLPSGLPGEYGYLVEHSDGSKDYFDVYGKPREHHNTSGNYFSYTYQEGLEDDVSSALLDYVQDSLGQKLQFERGDGTLKITSPNGDATTITHSEESVMTLEDVAGLKTTFDYVPFVGNDAQRILSSISHPSKLESRYEYSTAAYLDQNRSTKYVPTVQSYYQLDENESVQTHVDYDLGGFSGGNTFTGAAIGLKMEGATDTLMDGDGKALTYEYDVTKTSYDKEDNQSERTTTWFNNYHLPISRILYSLDERGGFREAFKTTYSYDISIEERARAAGYNKPTQVEVFYNSVDGEGEPNWTSLNPGDAKWDEYRGSSEKLDAIGPHQNIAKLETGEPTSHEYYASLKSLDTHSERK